MSWANPSKTESGEPVLVGVVYFRTKEYNVDPQDESVLRQLAHSYRGWATRNVGGVGTAQGLRGRIIGYADPRRSVEPDNAELSSRRADVTERLLRRFLVHETRLIDRRFDFDKLAGGVSAPVSERTDIEADDMSLRRRAEIWIAGQADSGGEVEDLLPQPEPVVPGGEAPAPDEWMKYWPYIERCHPEFAEDIANRVLAYQTSARLYYEQFKYVGTVPILVPIKGLPGGPAGKQLPSPKLPLGKVKQGGGDVLPLSAKKPPWWDARKSGYSGYLGRAALSPRAVKCHEMAEKAAMMIRDMRDLGRLMDDVINGRDGVGVRFYAELRKSHPDAAVLRELALPIEHMMFMWEALRDEAGELYRIIDELE